MKWIWQSTFNSIQQHLSNASSPQKDLFANRLGCFSFFPLEKGPSGKQANELIPPRRTRVAQRLCNAEPQVGGGGSLDEISPLTPPTLNLSSSPPPLPSTSWAPNNQKQALPLVPPSPSPIVKLTPRQLGLRSPFRRWWSRSKSAVKVEMNDCKTAGDRRHARFTASDICQKEVFNYNAPGLDKGKQKK